MHCNLTFYLFVSSSLLYLEVVVNVFDYFWKPNMLFSKFVLTAFSCTTPYTVLIALWKMFVEPVNAHALWWPCACLECVSGLWSLEKTLNFSRCIHIIDLVLNYGSDINERNWIQLLFYFIVLIGMAVFVIGMSFFSPVFQVLDWSFLVLHFDGNVCNCIPKMIWPWMDWFWGFLFKNGSSHQIHICMDWNLQELLICEPFLTTSFFRCFVWGVFLSVLWNCLYFFAVGFCNIDWLVLAMQCNFTFYLFVSSSPLYLEVVVNVFDYFWKPNSLLTKFCVNCLLMCYSVYCINSALKDVNGAC